MKLPNSISLNFFKSHIKWNLNQVLKMIKTEELCKLYSVKDKGKKWYSEAEIKKAISKCYSYGHAEPLTEYYNDKDDNLICIAELEEHLFAPDLNSRSSNEDSLNKGYEVNQKWFTQMASELR